MGRAAVNRLGESPRVFTRGLFHPNFTAEIEFVAVSPLASGLRIC
jgi:hypothetical protein